MSTVSVLDVQNLHVFYGQIHALHGVSLSVDTDEIVTLIGANGAGKTTTLGAISGVLPVAEGEVSLDGLHRIASEHIRSEGLQVLVVGDREVIEPGLKELGLPLVRLDADGNRV